MGHGCRRTDIFWADLWTSHRMSATTDIAITDMDPVLEIDSAPFRLVVRFDAHQGPFWSKPSPLFVDLFDLPEQIPS